MVRPPERVSRAAHSLDDSRDPSLKPAIYSGVFSVISECLRSFWKVSPDIGWPIPTFPNAILDVDFAFPDFRNATFDFRWAIPSFQRVIPDIGWGIPDFQSVTLDIERTNLDFQTVSPDTPEGRTSRCS